MIQQELEIINKLGLHARASAKFTQLAAKYKSDVWLTRNAALTDANSAVFDAANGFAGCISGIHEVLRRQGFLRSIACLDTHECLSPGQSAELDRVTRDYPWLGDDEFVATNLARWLV